MGFGVIEYDQSGKPKCEICGRYFNRVLSHVRQKHSMNEREYKKAYGFDLSKGICSKESSNKTRIKTLLNYEKCISINLKKKGESYRFKMGSVGRIKSMVSAQTRNFLKKRLKERYMQDAMRKSGEKLGKSGLGNKARWVNA